MDRVGGSEAGADDRTTRAFAYTILFHAIPGIFASIKYQEWQAGPNTLVESEPVAISLHGGLVDLYSVEILSAPDKVFIPARDGT